MKKTFLFLVACMTSMLLSAQTEGGKKPISQPLVSHIYTADPSAHVFKKRIFVYPSHDIESGVKEDDEGGHFDMRDHRNLS